MISLSQGSQSSSVLFTSSQSLMRTIERNMSLLSDDWWEELYALKELDSSESVLNLAGAKCPSLGTEYCCEVLLVC